MADDQPTAVSYKPRVGDRGTLYGCGDPEAAEIARVWSDRSVDVDLDSGGKLAEVAVLLRGEPVGVCFKPTLTISVDIGVVNAGTDTLPPIPPVPDVGDPLFAELMAVHNAIASLHRAAGVAAQTDQMSVNAQAVQASTQALLAGNAAMNARTTRAEVWLRAMLVQLSADQPFADPLSTDPAFMNTLREKRGVDWMDGVAHRIADLYDFKFPPAP